MLEVSGVPWPRRRVWVRLGPAAVVTVVRRGSLAPTWAGTLGMRRMGVWLAVRWTRTIGARSRGGITTGGPSSAVGSSRDSTVTTIFMAGAVVQGYQRILDLWK